MSAGYATTRLGGRYQLVREIGVGGMGRVFQAVDTETGRAVAAKIMLLEDERDLQSLLRFQQEGAVLSTLKHPNIVGVYGTFLEEHTSSIIMELLDGQSLWQILSRERLPMGRIKALMVQVCWALEYAHGHNIIHRDVKPSNIMVVGNDHVKVTDFGIARVFGIGATLRTMTGTTMGTPFYMSPEQIGGRSVDVRSDIYSAGVVLYEMVTGRRPFEAKDPISVAVMHVSRAPQPPSEIVGNLPADWDAIILKALAKGPSDRYPSAAALQEAIAGASDDMIGPPAPVPPDVLGQEDRVLPATVVRPSPDNEPPATVARVNPDTDPPTTVVRPAAESSPQATVLHASPDLGPPETVIHAGPDAAPGAPEGRAGTDTGPPATVVRVDAESGPPATVIQVRPEDDTPATAARIHAVADQPAPVVHAIPSSETALSMPAVDTPPAPKERTLQPGSSASPEAPPGGRSRTGGAPYVVRIVGLTLAAVAVIAIALVAYRSLAANKSASPTSTVKPGGSGNPTTVPGPNGVVVYQWGTTGSQPGQFRRPHGMTLDSDGKMYVADSGNDRIQEFTSSGSYLRSWGTGGVAGTGLNDPRGIAVDTQGNLYVADTGNNRIVKFGSGGKFVAAWGGPGSGKVEFREPEGLTINNGNIYVADTGNNRIQVLSLRGKFVSCMGAQSMCVGAEFNRPTAVAVNTLSDIFVADARNDRIQEMAPSGDLMNTWGSKSSGSGELTDPQGVSLDVSGELYVADTGNDRVVKFDSNGRFLSEWGQPGSGPGMFSDPVSVRADSQRNLYVVDTGNDRVQKLSLASHSSTQTGE
jgi:serine/threonine protein kinase/sugar lactone lactonase YvrE